ncbi:MAG TPA: homocysteine S-methyltransferase family protein [Chthonomonadaceae bacterium]|nr:homocysteine S-methyltransferase family protein [Chthonomonadaceae bacterium]
MPLQPARELRERLRAGERFLADGGMGSELIRYGVAPEDTLRANIGLPEAVRAIHDRYLRAGACILTCNTFGLRTGDDWAQALRAGIGLGVCAARESPQDVGVWVSLVPGLVQAERETLRFLAEHVPHWPGALLIETCTGLETALAAAQAARELPLDLLAVTCHFGAHGRMPDGTTPEEAARALRKAGADVVGGNCGETPAAFVEIAARMRAATDAPLLLQPSAGLPVSDAQGRWVYPVGPEEYARIAGQLFAAGANIVGGCCGTTPAHIAAAAAHAPHSQDSQGG